MPLGLKNYLKGIKMLEDDVIEVLQDIINSVREGNIAINNLDFKKEVQNCGVNPVNDIINIQVYIK